MTTPQQSKYDQILAGIEALNKAASSDDARLARIEEKVSSLEAKVSRVDKALYGNGEQGIRETVTLHAKRLDAVEMLGSKCKINEITTVVEDIQDWQTSELKAREEAKKSEADRTSEQRKFRYGLYTAIVISLIDLIARFVH